MYSNPQTVIVENAPNIFSRNISVYSQLSQCPSCSPLFYIISQLVSVIHLVSVVLWLVLLFTAASFRTKSLLFLLFHLVGLNLFAHSIIVFCLNCFQSYELHIYVQ